MPHLAKDQIIDASDIVAVIGERVSLKLRGREFIGLCPFHDDHSPSMRVSPQKQIFKCFSCGAGGDVVRFVQLYEKLEFVDALEFLARRAGLDFRGPGAANTSNSAAREQIRQTLLWAHELFRRNLTDSPIGAAAIEYAHRRGFSDETIRRFGLGFAPDQWDFLVSHARRAGVAPERLAQSGLTTSTSEGRTYDRFRNRLIFPIADHLGRLVGFGGRTLGDDPAKYLNSPEMSLFSKSRILYGLDLARRAIERSQSAIVVEGYADAVMIAQHGFEHVVATMGTALTDAHIKLVAPLVSTLYLCFDGDDAGQHAADRAAEIALRTGLDVRVVMFPDGEDPADCVQRRGAEGFRSCLQSAHDALEFKWGRTVKSFEAGGARSKRTAVDAFIQFVASVTASGALDPIQHGQIVGRLSQLLAVPLDGLYEVLAGARASQRRSSVVASGSNTADEIGCDTSDLSPGLVAAAEEMFGLLLTTREAVSCLDETMATVASFVPAWQRLHTIMRDLVDDQGSITRVDAQDRSDEPAVLDLIGRACRRITAGTNMVATVQSARSRLEAEMAVLQMTALQSALRTAADGSAEDKFRQMLDLAGQCRSVLPIERRVRASL